MEPYILLSELNDFIFCPRSIYWHHIFGAYDTSLYHTTDQTKGGLAHTTIDTGTYSSRKTILQGVSIFSEELKIMGKIDLYDTKTGLLTERKRKIHTIYDGYCLQLYGQYFCLSEMGYVVTRLRFHSLVDNKNYDIPLPNYQDEKKFRRIIDRFQTFRLSGAFIPNQKKCHKCIYNTLCDKALI